VGVINMTDKTKEEKEKHFWLLISKGYPRNLAEDIIGISEDVSDEYFERVRKLLK